MYRWATLDVSTHAAQVSANLRGRDSVVPLITCISPPATCPNALLSLFSQAAVVNPSGSCGPNKQGRFCHFLGFQFKGGVGGIASSSGCRGTDEQVVVQYRAYLECALKVLGTRKMGIPV